MKIAATVILYHPTEEVHENISSYLPFVDLLIITDNSEPNAELFLKRYISNPKILIVQNPINEGIAKPLNKAAEIALNKGFDWLLTMDQDSHFNTGMFVKYIECLSKTETENIAMAGVNYINSNFKNSACSWKEVPLLITSGSLVNLKHISYTGGFDENLFIDFVDSDYCWRSRLQGFKIMLAENIHIIHNLGEKTSATNVFGKNEVRKKYSSLRIYYMVRNYLYLKKCYGKKFVPEFKEQKSFLKNTLKNNLLYHRSRTKLIKDLTAAFADAKSQKMGKRQGV